jgi:hypothetical protein
MTGLKVKLVIVNACFKIVGIVNVIGPGGRDIYIGYYRDIFTKINERLLVFYSDFFFFSYLYL